jgi:energy-coupling factor transporter transmembrane protein EcfT
LKQLSLRPFYIPRNSFLHRSHFAAKLFIALFYTTVVFTRRTPLALLGLCLVIAMTTLIFRLPLRNQTILLVTILLLFLGVLVTPNAKIAVRLIVALGKIVCLMMIVAQFSMTTKLQELLQFGKPSNFISTALQPVMYVANSILAVLPSIQYDLQRAIDAETIRRGTKVQLYSVGSWVTILTVVLVRGLMRAERFTDTVIDRGFSSSEGLMPLSHQTLQWQDVMLTLLSIAPGLTILISRI